VGEAPEESDRVLLIGRCVVTICSSVFDSEPLFGEIASSDAIDIDGLATERGNEMGADEETTGTLESL
jgi:hypothetical protein